MITRKTAGALGAVGALMLAVALILTFASFDGATVAQWDSVCNGVIGQLGQALSSRARIDCGWAGAADSARGWLFGLGAVSVLAGVIFGAATRRPPAPGSQAAFQPLTPGPQPAFWVSAPPAAPAATPPLSPQPQMPLPSQPPPESPLTAPLRAEPLASPPAARNRVAWERLIWPVTTVVIVAVLTVGGVLAVDALRPSPPQRTLACTAPAVGCAYGGMESEPVQITTSADGSATINDLRWSGWGSPTATANGVLELDNCSPDCAGGTYTPYRASVTLYGLRPYGSGRAYDNMRVTAPGAPYQPMFRNLVPALRGT